MYRCIWRIYLCNVVQQPRSENCRFVQPTGQKRFKLDTGFWQNKTFCSLSNNLQGRFVVQVLSKRRFIFISHKLQSSMKTRLEPESPFTFQFFVKKKSLKKDNLSIVQYNKDDHYYIFQSTRSRDLLRNSHKEKLLLEIKENRAFIVFLLSKNRL